MRMGSFEPIYEVLQSILPSPSGLTFELLLSGDVNVAQRNLAR